MNAGARDNRERQQSSVAGNETERRWPTFEEGHNNQPETMEDVLSFDDTSSEDAPDDNAPSEDVLKDEAICIRLIFYR